VENEVGIWLWIAVCPWMLGIASHAALLADLIDAAWIGRQVRQEGQAGGVGESLSFTIC
jgi:hypothetical protein